MANGFTHFTLPGRFSCFPPGFCCNSVERLAVSRFAFPPEIQYLFAFAFVLSRLIVVTGSGAHSHSLFGVHPVVLANACFSCSVGTTYDDIRSIYLSTSKCFFLIMKLIQCFLFLSYICWYVVFFVQSQTPQERSENAQQIRENEQAPLGWEGKIIALVHTVDVCQRLIPVHWCKTVCADSTRRPSCTAVRD